MRNILSRGLMTSCLIAFAHMSLAAEPESVQSGKEFEFMQEEIKKVVSATGDHSITIRICEQKQSAFPQQDWKCDQSSMEIGALKVSPGMRFGKISSTSTFNYVVGVGKRPDAEGFVAEYDSIKLHSTFVLYADSAGLPRFEYSYLGINDVNHVESMDPETSIDLLSLSDRNLDAAVPREGEVFSSLNRDPAGKLYYIIVSRGGKVELPESNA